MSKQNCQWWKKKKRKQLTKATFNFTAYRLHRLWTGGMPHIPTQQGHTVRNWWPASEWECTSCVWQRSEHNGCLWVPTRAAADTVSCLRLGESEVKVSGPKQTSHACWGSFSDDGFSVRPRYKHTACKLQNHMLDRAVIFQRHVQQQQRKGKRVLSKLFK